MKRAGLLRLGWAAGGVVGAMLLGMPGWARPQGEESLPEAAVVLERLLERAQATAQSGLQPLYAFQSRAIHEELDSNGEVVKSEERLYQGEWIAGLPFKRLVKIEGRDLTAEELAAEQRREEQFRESLSSVNPREVVARKESVITSELLGLFRFEVKERMMLENRPTLVVTFKPKSGPLAKGSIRDRVLSRLQGMLWVDEAEADTARLTVTLVEPFSLGWLGILGSLTECYFRLERRRMPDGVWLNTRQLLQLQYRQLVSTSHFRKTELSSDFKKVEAGR